MKTRNKKVLITLGIVLLVLVAIFSLVGSLLKSPEYPTPSGEYSVGTHLFTAVDSTRDEILSKTYSGPRKVVVRAFYPTYEKSGNYLKIDDKRVIDAIGELYNIPAIADETALSKSIVDAVPAEGGKFPVIVYSHGSFSYSTQNLTSYEELASRGYIVLALSHTYESVATVLPNNEVIYSEQQKILEKLLARTSETHIKELNRLKELKTGITNKRKVEILEERAKEYYREAYPLIETRIDDMSFIAEYIQDETRTNELPFHDIIDRNTLGAYGHSLGGLTAQYACSAIDTLYDAGISMDMTPYILENRSHQLQVPFNFFYSSQMTIGDAGSIDISDTNSYFENSSIEEVFTLRFEGTKHNNFMDINLIPPLFKFIPGMELGKIDGEKMIDLLNNSIADYFDYRLKGKKNIYTSLEPGSEELEIEKIK